MTDRQVWDAVVRTNVDGAFFALREVARIMTKQRAGRIVTITSMAAALHLEGTGAYAASKAALVEMTKVLARELASSNVTCNAVGVSMVMTVAAQGARVSKVLLTHGHHDHVGAVAPVCHALNVPCAVHPADMRLVRQAPLWAFRFAGKLIDTPSPMVELTDDVVRIGGASLNVIRVPGHTPGGIAFASNGFCMTGDTLLLEHIGRTDLPGGHAPAMQQSADHLLSVLSADTILLAGHGREWTAGEALGWWSRVRAAPPVLDEHQTAS